MYRKSDRPALTPEKFELPVAIELSSQNRWAPINLYKYRQPCI
ncbi:MAG: hypothetical protein QNJ41_07555 [Xenococcaceae cyanobacterium MO_188.B32]|nr:hypothetical protein [Xenococcaceae cyanobacterium MO_188.B32]